MALQFQILQFFITYKIYLDMARTKQTARRTCAGKAPRRIVNSGIEIEESSQKAANTDQFSLKFDDQEKCEKEAVSHEMRRCDKCEAFLTAQSLIIKKQDYSEMKTDHNLTAEQKKKYLRRFQNVWICEFCLNHNNIPIGYVPPPQENPCFLLQKGEEGAKMEEQQAPEEDKILIFCIDISGSMDCYFDGKSRLNSVKEAILDEINRLKFQKSKIRIGLITFGSEVNLIGDGKKFKQKVLKTDIYHDFNKMIKESEKIKNFCEPLSSSYTSLKKIVGNLHTSGLTALGPGLIAAVQIASHGAIGSKVILCTDGQANVGIGGSHDESFYTKMANVAKKKRVMVNILSLKGDNCNLKFLGKLSLATGGSLLKIDPKALGTQFSKIMEEQMLGTSSNLTVRVNKIFRITNPPFEAKLSEDCSSMNQDFGNFSADTQLMFQFETIHKDQAQKISSIDMELYKKSKVPMQIQLEYVGRKGEKYLQIITDWRQLVENQSDVYEGANFGLFAASVLQRASQKIKQNNFDGANEIIKSYWSLVKDKFEKTQKQEQLQKFNSRVKRIEKVLGSKKHKRLGSSSRNKKVATKSRARGRGRKSSRSRSRSKSIDMMNSDSQEQVLMKQIRARSRSRSREKKPRKNK